MTDAAHRVEAFLDARSSLPGLHDEFITGVGHEGGIHALTTGDLRTLVAQARALEVAAPLAFRAIEADPDTPIR